MEGGVYHRRRIRGGAGVPRCREGHSGLAEGCGDGRAGLRRGRGRARRPCREDAGKGRVLRGGRGVVRERCQDEGQRGKGQRWGDWRGVVRCRMKRRARGAGGVVGRLRGWNGRGRGALAGGGVGLLPEKGRRGVRGRGAAYLITLTGRGRRS
ncbi:chromatin target of PRMT1 protein-like [Ananas comosus]|uniref:Chromatin target of PRMT1 protein-like n=1 Tax=Ananas comosus TaxID=4615 RepID=A0A6P5FF62_ANACO|nr:chromatin target of PRMT1 protein-like [Ananas comosus]